MEQDMNDGNRNALRRHPDHAIDTEFYLARGRRARSAEGRALFTTLLRGLRRAWRPHSATRVRAGAGFASPLQTPN
jgi:hypothetical protein